MLIYLCNNNIVSTVHGFIFVGTNFRRLNKNDTFVWFTELSQLYCSEIQISAEYKTILAVHVYHSKHI